MKEVVRVSSLGKALVITALIVLVIALTVAIYLGAAGYYPTKELRPLAKYFVWYTFNPYKRIFWAGSPEAVNAILWDYRGLDTVFETTVLFAAVLGCLVIAKDLRVKELIRVKELTPIVSIGAKIVIAVIILASLALALHGYISPGGGFQGGSAAAIAPLLAIAAYSWYVIRRRVWLSRSAGVRTVGLLGIVITALIPLVFHGYLMQNQWKPWSGFPGIHPWLGKFFIGGTLIIYNLSEFLVVSMEFILIFIALTLITSEGGGEGGG